MLVGHLYSKAATEDVVNVFLVRLVGDRLPFALLARVLLILCCVGLLSGIVKAAELKEYEFNIPQQSVLVALEKLAIQVDVLLLFPYEQVLSIDANPVVGVYSVKQALDILLQGTGLSGDLTEGGVITISRLSSNKSKWEQVMNKKKTRKSLLASIVALFTSTLTTSNALGQEELGETENSLGLNAIEEVIVSATRRDVSLQDTSISIQAVNEDMLQKLGAVDIDGMVYQVPGLIKTGVDYTIRGLSSQLDNGNGDSTVSRYLDETPINHDFRLFDVSRVEVLRGPQGSLYGAGALGGTIRIVTNQPDSSEFYGKVDTEYSFTEQGGANNEFNAAINIPLVKDQLALRLVGYRHDYEGFIDNSTLGINNINSEDIVGGRAALRWDVNPDLSVTVSYLFEEIEQGGSDSEIFGLDGLDQFRLIKEASDNDVQLGNLLVNLDLGQVKMVFSGSYDKSKTTSDTDVTAILNPNFIEGIGGSGFQKIVQSADEKSWGKTAELRFISDFDDSAWQWIVGGFYSEDGDKATEPVFVTEFDPDSPYLGDFVGVLSGLSDPNMLLDQRIRSDEREAAGFGELSYQLTEQLAVTAGFRYLDIKQRSDAFADAALFNSFGSLPRINANHNDYYTKYKLTYTPDDDKLFYFTRSEGFRRGGFNASSAIGLTFGVANIPVQFDSDLVTNWELGWHTSWLENRLIFNGALYVIDWEDIRVDVTHPSGLTFTDNGPQAESRGIELELHVLPMEYLDIFFTAAYTDTELTKEQIDTVLEDDDVPYPDNLTLAPKGEALPGIPQQNYSLSIDYTMPALIGSFDAYTRVDISYTGSSYNTYRRGPFSHLREKMDDYILTNLRLGIENNKWDVALYVENLDNVRADLYIDQFAVGNQNAYRNRPRTIGINVRAEF